MKLYPDLSDDVLDEFLETNSGEFLDLYNNYMYREMNIYEFAGHVGCDVYTLQRLLDLFTKQSNKRRKQRLAQYGKK